MIRTRKVSRIQFAATREKPSWSRSHRLGGIVHLQGVAASFAKAVISGRIIGNIQASRSKAQ